MFNKTGITKETATAPVQILFDVEHQMSVSIRVSDAGVVANAEGKKIVKAGAPLHGDLAARGTAFTAAATTEAIVGNLVVGAEGGTVVLPVAAHSNATGVLLNDVDVTAGAANGTLLINGYVNTSRLDATTAALITAEVKTALDGKVTFLVD